MHFGKISNIKLNFSSYFKKDKAEQVKNADVSQEEKSETLPSCPQYWQNSLGLEKKYVDERTFEVAKSQIENKFSDKFYDTSVIDDFLKKASNDGADIFNSYTKFLLECVSLMPTKSEEELSDIFSNSYEFISKLNGYYNPKIAPIITLVSRYKNENKFIEMINNILDDKVVLPSQKVLWLYENLGYANNLKTETFLDLYPPLEQEYKNYSNLTSKVGMIDARGFIYNSNNYSEATYQDICKILDSKYAPNEQFCAHVRESFDLQKFSSNQLFDFLDLLKNEDNLKLYSKLNKVNFMHSKLTIHSVLQTFAKESKIFPEILDFVLENQEYFGYCGFSSPSNFLETLDLIDEKNFDEYCDFTLSIESFVGSSIKNTAISSYVNPFTLKFDKSIYDAETKIINRLPRATDTLGCAHEMIDSKTKKISPIAQKVIDELFPQTLLPSSISKVTNKVLSRVGLKRPKFSVSNDVGHLTTLLIREVKDEKGEFSQKNCDFLAKLVNSQPVNSKNSEISLDNLITFLQFCKDENGIVKDSRVEMLMKLYNVSGDMKEASVVLTPMIYVAQSDRDKLFDALWDIPSDNQNRLANFDAFTEFAVDKNGKIVPWRLDFLRKLVETKDAKYNTFFLEHVKEFPQLADTIIDFAKESKYGMQFYALGKALKALINEDGLIDDEKKTRALNYIATGLPLNIFPDIYSEYQTLRQDTGSVSFDEKGYNEFLSLVEKTKITFTPDSCETLKSLAKLLKGNIELSELNFQSKISLLKFLEQNKNLVPNNEIIKSAISEIEASLSMSDISIPISREVKLNFIKNVLASSATLTKFESVLAASSKNLENMKNGLPLKYTRKDFLTDITSICPSERLSEIEKKLNVQFVYSAHDSALIVGYDGLLKHDELNLNDPIEKQVSDCVNRFLFENKVVSDNSELNEQMNYILEALPEFINIIGKKQHQTHNHTLDIHSLLVLSYSLNNPDYLTRLNLKDRSLLKLAALFHDITKKEGQIDQAHPEHSSMYARSISGKFFKSSELRDRFYGLINNHHWTKKYNVPDKTQVAKELAFKFRRPNDFEIAQIMARSDLMAVSSDFAKRYVSCLDRENLNPIYENLEFLYQSSNAVFVDKVFLKEKLNNHIQKYNKRDYKVINLHQISDDFDMYEYGFKHGTKKKDLRFLVHMVDELKLDSQLNTLKMLTRESNDGVLSESIISPDYKHTYSNRKFGVFLSQANSNVINIGKTNQGSGVKKDIKNAIDLVFGGVDSKLRKQYRTNLLKHLGINPDDISDLQYAEFYRKHIVNLSTLTEIAPTRVYKLGKYNFDGELLAKALKNCQDSFLDDSYARHNEVVGYAPKIQGVVAKVKTLKEVPSELLDFAYKYDLPILLI